jgi:hypothetical protein
MTAALRCESKKHAEMISDHVIEVKCSSRFCGARRGVVVLHQFDLSTGTMTTRKFTDPHRVTEKERKPA